MKEKREKHLWMESNRVFFLHLIKIQFELRIVILFPLEWLH